MTPEEKFNNEVWWILQELKKESLYNTQPDFTLRTLTNNNTPSFEIQRKLLYKLREWEAIDFRQNLAESMAEMELSPYEAAEEALIHPPKLPKIPKEPTRYVITLHQPKFDEIYNKYKALINPTSATQQSTPKQEKPKLSALIQTSNYVNVPAKIVVTDLQSKYQEIEIEKDLVQFYMKIAHYGQYVLENAATMYVLESLYKEAENDAKPYVSAWQKFFQEWKVLASDILEQAKKVGITDDNPLSNEIADITSKLQRNETSLWESDISNYYTSYWYLIRRFNDLGKSNLLIPKHFASSESSLTISDIYNEARNEWDKFEHSREAKVWWAHYQVCRLAAGILDLKERENYFKDDNAIDGFYKFEFEELSKGNTSRYPIVLHENKYRVWIKRLHEYLIPRLQNVDMNWVISTFRKNMYLEDQQKNTEQTSWSDKFKWVNEDFYFNDSNKISFGAKSSYRKTVFQMLTDAKGEWVKVSDMASKIGKSHGETRTILAQLNKDKLEKIGIISIISKSDTNEPGAYRIKLLNKN